MEPSAACAESEVASAILRPRTPFVNASLTSPRATLARVSPWSVAYQNALPDNAFLHVETGGEKDESGKTTPRSLRHFPVYDAEGHLDLPHLTNAIARIPQASSDWISGGEKDRLQERAVKMLADAHKTTHKRAVGLSAWAMDYVAHADDHEAMGITGEAVSKAWKGDVMLGKRAAELLRGLTLKTKDKVSKRVTKAIDKLLRVKVVEHNTATPPPQFMVRASTVKLAYQRGVQAYAKSARPCVKSAPQWGFARAAALLSYCKTGSFPHPSYTGDLDILPRAPLRKDELAPSDLAAGGALAPQQNLTRTTFAGLPIVIDRPKGYVQTKTDAAGEVLWSREYKVPYGYIPSTLGGDAEELDVFLGPDPTAPSAFWVVQNDDAGEFDEYKVVLGAEDEAEARQIYLDHVPEKFLGRMFETPVGALHALLGLEPTDLLKAVDPGYHFVASRDGDLLTAHPWTTLGMSAPEPGEDEDAPARAPTLPMTIGAAAHTEMAAAIQAIKAVMPVGCSKAVTPLAAGFESSVAPDDTALVVFSAPDPFVADHDAILSAAEEAKAALVELPETSKNVAALAKLGGVFKLASVPGRVFVATYPLPRSGAVQPIDQEEMVWAAEPESTTPPPPAAATESSPVDDSTVAKLYAALAEFAKAMDEQLATDPPEADGDLEDDVEKDVKHGPDGKFAGGSGGGHAPTHVSQVGHGAFAAQGNTAHDDKMHWAGVKAKETGKPVHVVPDKKSDPKFSGGVKLSYKAPKKGPHSTVHPDGSITHQKSLAAPATAPAGEVGKAESAPDPVDVLKGLSTEQIQVLADRYAAQIRAAAAGTEVGKAGTYLQISKSDDAEERYTLGIVLVPDEPDLQGDIYGKPTIRRAADIFMADYQNTALQHNVKPGDIAAFHDEHPELYNGKILIVDSFVIPDEMGDVTINGHLVKAGTWLMGHRWVDDALWADVKAGKYTGLSMGGFARRIALSGSGSAPTAA